MFARKLAAFSPCGEFFACNNDVGILTIWETSSNIVKQEYSINSHLNTTCTCLIWGSFENTIVENNDENGECQLLIIGTKEGGVYLFDTGTGRLINHFIAGHSDVVNDLSFDSETNHLYSCSSDKSVIIWDTVSGKINQKWNADNQELYSICVIDSNSLLTGSTSVLWWNIKEQSVIKKFSCHEAPITLLSVVNSTDATAASYFLCASAKESKISAWSLSEKNCKTAVASFVLPDELQNIDASKSFSKDNPLLLTAVTKSGALLLFQHVLNGKTKNLKPQMTLRVTSKANGSCFEPSSIPVISSKILDCAEACIIAYGSEENPVFESVNIFDCPKTLTLSREKPLPKNVHNKIIIAPQSKLYDKLNEHAVINGQTSVAESPPYSSPKRRKLKTADVESAHNLQNEIVEPLSKMSTDSRISTKSSPNVKKKLKLSKKLQEKGNTSESDSEEYTTPTNPSEMVDCLIRGIEEERTAVINSVLQCDNSELIRSSVRHFPLHSLNLILLELYRRLILKEKRYNSSLRKWLKETLAVHLPYLVTCKDLTDILERIKEHIDTRNVGETLLKMNMLKGLLKIQTRTFSAESTSSESESDEEHMES